MNWKGFYFWNEWERISLQEDIGNSFAIELYWKGFFKVNSFLSLGGIGKGFIITKHYKLYIIIRMH